VNLQQLRAEAADPTPVRDHGWQEAFQAIYPLKINEVRVTDGRITYVDEGPFAPLEVTRVNLTARNIRNIRSKDRTYPSDVHLDAVVAAWRWTATPTSWQCRSRASRAT
jgi:hypothetical protein